MATPFTFYIADLTDPTAVTRLVDFNGYESDTGPFLVDENSLDMGGAELEETWLGAEGVDDDVLAASSRRHAVVQFDLHYIRRSSSESLATLSERFNTLNQALDTPGLIVMKPPGGETRYIDYLRSPLAIPMNPGPRRLWELFNTLTSPDGLHVAINRRSKMRGAALMSGVQQLHNPTFAEDHDGDGVPSLWAWDSTTGITGMGFSWPLSAYSFTYARSGTNLLQQTITPAAEGEQWTMAFEGAAVTSGRVVTLKARIEFLDGSNSLVGSVHDGAAAVVVDPAVGFAIATVTATAPATTAKVRCSLLVSNSNTDANTVYLRKAQAELGAVNTRFRVGAETVSNDVRDPFGKRMWLWGDGNIDGLGILRAAPSAGSSVIRLRTGRRAGFRNSYQSAQVFPGVRGVDATALSGSTPVSDTAATGDEALQTSVISVYQGVMRFEAPQSTETALRGRWSVQAAMRFPTGWIGNVQVRYGLSDVADLRRTLDDISVDMTVPATSQYVTLDFGVADVPPNADGLFVELWARRTGGSGSPLVDVMWLVPADDAQSLTLVPGHDDPGSLATETYLPADLDTPTHPAGMSAGEIVGSGDYVLNDTDEAAGLPESATASLSAVLHTFTASGSMYNPGSARLVHGFLRVYDITSTTQIAEAALIAPKGSRWPAYTASVKFTPVAGHAYSIYVRQTIDGSDGNIHIRQITKSFIPPLVGGSESLVIDGASRRAYVEDSGLFVQDLDHVPPFPALEPGLQLLVLSTAEDPASGYGQVSPGRDLAKHVPDTTFDVTFDQVPRWTH